MKIALAYLISFLIGYCVIALVQAQRKILQPSLYAGLALGIGLGISALLTFLTFLLFNRFHPTAIIGFNISFLIALLTTCVLKSPGQNKITRAPGSALGRFRLFHAIALCVWGLCAWAVYFVAKIHPFGEWDAWALWNMKTKFLLFGGPNWDDILTKLHWHTQPDYPLLLPLINTWIYAWAGENLQQVAFTTAIVLTLSCAFLLFAGLNQFMKKELAYLFSLCLLVNPYYMYLGTAQYADILLAFYLLAAVIVLLLALRENHAGMAVTCGLVMGLMSFAKNEGMVLALLMALILSLYLSLQKLKDRRTRRKLFVSVLLGLGITGLAAVVFKLFLAPANRDILTDLTMSKMNFFNLGGLAVIIRSFLNEIAQRRWSYIWIFALFMIAIRCRRLFWKECGLLTCFFTAYGAVLTLIYLTTVNFDLSWRLTSTLHRILFYMLPSVLFYCFYLNTRDQESFTRKEARETSS